MPIISRIGRKSLRTRTLIGLIYIVLVTGSVVMVYPFAIMLSGSFKSPVDLHDYDAIPRYWYDDLMLFRKYVEERYNQSETWMNATWKTSFIRFEDVLPPAVYSETLLNDWLFFLRGEGVDKEYLDREGKFPLSWFQPAAFYSPTFRKPTLYQQWLKSLSDLFNGDINALNRTWNLNFGHFYMIVPVAEDWLNRRYVPELTPLYDHYLSMKRSLRESESCFLLPVSVDMAFLGFYIWPKYTRNIDTYNESHGTRYLSFSEVILSEQPPEVPHSREEWLDYASDEWRARNIRLGPQAQEKFREFLLTRYQSLENIARRFGLEYVSPDTFHLPEILVSEKSTSLLVEFREFLRNSDSWTDCHLQTELDWSEFVRNELHVQFIRLIPEGLEHFKNYLAEICLMAAQGDPEKAVTIFREKYCKDKDYQENSLEELVKAFEVPQPMESGTPLAVDFADFLADRCPVEYIRVTTLDTLFARYLEKKYGTIENLEKAIHQSLVYPQGNREFLVSQLSPLGQVALEILVEHNKYIPTDLFRIVDEDLKKRDPQSAPQPCLLDRLKVSTIDELRQQFLRRDQELITWIRQIDAFHYQRPISFRGYTNQEYARDWIDLLRNKRAIRKEFIISNYRVVLNFIMFHGRALYNTLFFVVSMIFWTLLINPVAAYALSRFQLPSTYKILLFFMATMAFPPEVTMIPGFLLLKNFPLGYLVVIGSVLIFVGILSVKLAQRYPIMWSIVEFCLMVILLVAVLIHTLPVLRDYSLTGEFRPQTLRALLLLGSGLSIGVFWTIVRLSHRKKQWQHYLPGIILIAGGILGLCVTPYITTKLGFHSPNVSLLNTFWALILPSVANGYAIFLLKGFFDSLPQNLYESAQLEGAKELWMFWNITLPLSKPILAVIALQTFNVAYTTFMYAFIVCQDPKMWTLMVWLYDMQFDSPQYVIFAGLVVAAIPTLLVFILTQRIIMRGIIIPVEK